MKKQAHRRNHSQILNNFYTLVTIVIMTAVITLYSKYIHPHKEPTFIPTVLPCLSELKIEQRLSNTERLVEAMSLFKEGNYMVDGGLILNDNTTLDKHISIKSINEYFHNASDVVAINNAQKYLNIKYEIIESDKTANLLEFLVSFRISANEVMRMYTYLPINNLEEIPQKVECIMNSFKANAK